MNLFYRICKHLFPGVRLRRPARAPLWGAYCYAAEHSVSLDYSGYFDIQLYQILSVVNYDLVAKYLLLGYEDCP